MADNTPGTWEERLRGLNECVGLLPPTENHFRFAPRDTNLWDRLAAWDAVNMPSHECLY
jgi:hypothetical protein